MEANRYVRPDVVKRIHLSGSRQRDTGILPVRDLWPMKIHDAVVSNYPSNYLDGYMCCPIELWRRERALLKDPDKVSISSIADNVHNSMGRGTSNRRIPAKSSVLRTKYIAWVRYIS